MRRLPLVVGLAALLFIAPVGTALHAADTVPLNRTQWTFAEHWSVWKSPEWAVLTALPSGGQRLTLAPAGAGQEAIIFTGERDFRTLGRAHALTVTISADGAGGTVFPRLIDARGRWLIGEQRQIAAGSQTLRWELPGDLRDPTPPTLPLRFNDLVLARGAGEAPLALTLAACDVEEAVAPVQAVAVALEAGHPLGLVQPGGAPPQLALRNRIASALALRVELETSGYAGVLGRWSGDLDLAPGAVARPSLPAADSVAPGIRWLRWRLVERGAVSDAAGSAVAEGLASWAVLAPVPRGEIYAPGFQFCVCTHTERWSGPDQAREALAAGALGATSARTGVGWGRVQPAASTWDFTPMDRLVDLYAAQGVELQPILGYGNSWADQPGDYPAAKSWFRPPRSAPWREYVHGMAAHYRGKIRFWEVWNEPDLDGFFPGSTAQYIDLLRAAHEEVRRGDPQAQVMTGGFAGLTDHGARATNPRLMEQVLGEASDAFDILAFHQHGSFAEVFQPIVDGPLARLRATLSPAKPLWFNETAVSYNFDSTADLLAKQAWQADELVRKLSFARARGAIGYTWYDLRNDGEDPKDFEHNFGLLTSDFQPKAAFSAYAEMIRRMRGTEFARAFDLGANRHAYLFSRPAAGAQPTEHVVVLFNQDARMADLEVAATWDAGIRAELVDAMGAPLAGAATDAVAGGRAFAVGNRPTLLLVHGGAAPRVAPLITVGDPGPVRSGRPLTAAVSFTNPFPRPTALTLAWRLPAALGGAVTKQTLNVPAAGTVTASPAAVTTVPAGGTGDVDLGARLEWTLDDGAWKGAVAVPLHVAVVVPPADPARAPDFVLDRPGQVVNRFMNDPAHTALLWQGPADLSARVWLEHGAAGLAIRVAVRDAVHHQQFTGVDLWRADSVQLALVVPGQQGWWEIGLARGDDGAPRTWCWRRPAGFADPLPALRLTAEAADGGIDYRLAIPDAVLGLDPAALAERGLAFNLVINDDDGDGGRKGWIQLAPGIADNKDPTKFPLVVFGK